MIAGERIEMGDFVDIFVDKKTGKSIIYKIKPPKTERQAVCDEIISYIAPMQNTTIKYDANQIIVWIKLIRDIRR